MDVGVIYVHGKPPPRMKLHCTSSTSTAHFGSECSERTLLALEPNQKRSLADVGVIMGTACNEEWPPDAGWHFRDREAAVLGFTFPVAGKHADLLKTLIVANNDGISATSLRRMLWREDQYSRTDQSLQQMVSDLRGRVRKATGVHDIPVILSIGRGRRDRRYQIDPAFAIVIEMARRACTPSGYTQQITL